MKPLILWRYEIRRAGWAPMLAPPTAAALAIVLAVLSRQATDAATARTLLSAVEMAVPLAAGAAAGSLVGGDPLVELQLSLPTPYRVTLVRRLAVTLGWAALVAVVVAGTLMATGWWARWPAHHGALAGQLTWLAPTALFGGGGFLAAAALRSAGAAGALITTFWIVEQLFADAAQQHRWSRLLYPFATTRGTVAADWTANRITLVVAGIVCAGAGWLLLGRAERLLPGDAA